MPESEEPTVTQLVTAAAARDRAAWNQLVDRFTSLVISTARRYRLGEHDVADVAQTVWLQLVEHLGELREPEALPGWLASTTRHECVRLIERKSRQRPYDPLASAPADQARTPDIALDVADGLDQLEPAAGRARRASGAAGIRSSAAHAARRGSASELRRDQPAAEHPYRQHRPTRGRALKRLRATASVSQLVDSDT